MKKSVGMDMSCLKKEVIKLSYLKSCVEERLGPVGTNEFNEAHARSGTSLSFSNQVASLSRQILKIREERKHPEMIKERDPTSLYI